MKEALNAVEQAADVVDAILKPKFEAAEKRAASGEKLDNLTYLYDRNIRRLYNGKVTGEEHDYWVAPSSCQSEASTDAGDDEDEIDNYSQHFGG